jgi:toxin HigB-1
MRRSVIRSFSDRRTAALFQGISVKDVSREVARMARRKLDRLHQAGTLADLAAFPGNHLEKLAGDRAGQRSIRVNKQWRICFRWEGGDAHDVWFGDYH